MKIILTGATGLIGSRFIELLSNKHEIIPLSSSQGFDIADIDSINVCMEGVTADAIVHLAAKTDVDACEADKAKDLEVLNINEGDIKNLDLSKIDARIWKGKTTAFAVNTIGTKNLSDIAKKKNIKFIYISTDFIFSGEDEFYNEESSSNPISWYGMTKYFGEKFINKEKDLIVRISYPYGYQSSVKKDFVQKLITLLLEKEEVGLVSDQIITPTFIDDIVVGIDFLISKKTSGIINLTGSSSLRPIMVGQMIKEKFGLRTIINSISLENLYRGKAHRPFKSIIKNDKLVQLGFKPKTFDEGFSMIIKGSL